MIKFGTCHFGKIGILIAFIIQKLKNKHLVCLSFLCVFFENKRNNFTHILGVKDFCISGNFQKKSKKIVDSLYFNIQ